MSTGSSLEEEARPSALQSLMFFFLNSAAVLNAFAKAKAKCLKHTIMKVIVFFQVKCLLWVKVINTGIALW